MVKMTTAKMAMMMKTVMKSRVRRMLIQQGYNDDGDGDGDGDGDDDDGDDDDE